MKDEHGHEVRVSLRERGLCGVRLSANEACEYPAGCHDLGDWLGVPYQVFHRSYGSYGDGQWIDYDVVTLKEVRRGGGRRAAVNSAPTSSDLAHALRCGQRA